MAQSSGIDSRTRVLIADDEPTIAETLRIIVERDGFEVRTADCGASAVEIAQFWKPHLLLTDVLMPIMNGTEAAIRICELLPDCRVLLLSGAGLNPETLRAVRHLGYRFESLRKPVHPTRLLRTLHELADRP